MTDLRCPRDDSALIARRVHDIEVDHCTTCNGRWLDHHELDELEATRAGDEGVRRATIRYADRDSELRCPVCGRQMSAFNYRGYDLELDVCEEEHGFWLDAGEDGRVRDIIDERVRGLRRAASAEEAWKDFLDGVGGGGVWKSVRSFFGGGRRR
ncbi:MAG: zf-TFIIB domain-containing protein [Chloroflexi bacterium]|nr:zf-TFIIB domain-containing protein [Chloroflexota bacterium]